jgi:hypothetical protein
MHLDYSVCRPAARRNRAQEIKSRQLGTGGQILCPYICYLDTAVNKSDFNSPWKR